MKNKTYLQKLIYTAFFSALMIVGAYVKIPTPFSPVPITLQTLFVLLSGAVLGPVFGAVSQIIYIMLGVAGFPIFASSLTGPMVLAGPTGGYLIGFVICAFVVGLLCQITTLRAYLKVVIWFYMGVFVVGTIIIYVFGAAGLMLFMKISFTKAVTIGVLPFIIGDILKIIAAAYLIEKIKIK